MIFSPNYIEVHERKCGLKKIIKKPPDNFIGKLWLGVRDSFKSDKSDDVANGSDLNHTKDVNEPYVPLE